MLEAYIENIFFPYHTGKFERISYPFYLLKENCQILWASIYHQYSENNCFNIAIISVFSGLGNFFNIYFNIYLKPQVLLYCCFIWLIIVKLFRNICAIILNLHLHPQASNQCSDLAKWKKPHHFVTQQNKNRLKMKQ